MASVAFAAKWFVLTAILAPGQTPPPSSQSDDRPPDHVLDAVPADAWAVLSVRNMRDFDGKLAALAGRLSIPMALGTPLAVAKGLTGLLAGVEDDAGLALALMPIQDVATIGRSFLLVIPTADHDALAATLRPEESPDEIRRFLFLGHESFMAPKGRFTLMSQSRETLAAALAADQSIRSVMEKDYSERFATDDAALYLNTAVLTRSGLFARLADRCALSETEQDWLRSLTAAVATLRLQDDGVRVTGLLSADPQSPAGRYITRPGDDCGSLLRTLPDHPFILAAAVDRGETDAGHEADWVGDWIESRAEGGASGEAVQAIRSKIERVIAETRGIAFAVLPLTGEALGLVCATAVISCEGNSREVRRDLIDALETGRREFGENTRAAEILDLIEYRAGAEKLSDLDVDHLVLKLPEGVQPEAKREISSLLGEEGPRVRLTTPDDNHLVLVFGGGGEHLTDVINTMRGEGEALSSRKGVRETLRSSQGAAFARAFLAVDAYLKWYADLLRAVGQPPTLVEPEPVGAPVAITLRSGGSGAAGIDIDVPIELLIALKAAWDERGRGPAESDAPEPAG